jgi:hypothetical protein
MGRPKGALNKKFNARLIAEALDYDPLYNMIIAAQDEPDPKQKFAMDCQIVPYLYAKLKNVEHSFDEDKGIKVIIEDFGSKK